MLTVLSCLLLRWAVHAETRKCALLLSSNTSYIHTLSSKHMEKTTVEHAKSWHTVPLDHMCLHKSTAHQDAKTICASQPSKHSSSIAQACPHFVLHLCTKVKRYGLWMHSFSLKANIIFELMEKIQSTTIFGCCAEHKLYFSTWEDLI